MQSDIFFKKDIFFCYFTGGLLSIIVDAYFKGTIEDALLVPISINYDRLVDGNFTREQLGEPKQPETLWGTISAIFKTITSFYGLMRVDFNQPFSLKVCELSPIKFIKIGQTIELELSKMLTIFDTY